MWMIGQMWKNIFICWDTQLGVKHNGKIILLWIPSLVIYRTIQISHVIPIISLDGSPRSQMLNVKHLNKWSSVSSFPSFHKLFQRCSVDFVGWFLIDFLSSVWPFHIFFYLLKYSGNKKKLLNSCSEPVITESLGNYLFLSSRAQS